MFKNKKGSLNKNTKCVKSKLSAIKVLVFFSIIIMLVFTAFRAYTLNAQLNETNKDCQTLKHNVERYNDMMLRTTLEDGNKLAYYRNRSNTDILEARLVEEHGLAKMYDVLGNHNYDPDVYDTIYDTVDKYFTANEPYHDNLLIVGTAEGILLTESSTQQSKFNKLKGTNELITWEQFYKGMVNPTVTKKAFEDLKAKKTNEPVIMRIDGKYIDNKTYTVDDLIKAYKEKGVNGLKGFGFLSLSTITENGDIFGNKDNTFMMSNPNVKKIYVYRYSDIHDFINEDLKQLTENNIYSTRDISRVDEMRKQDIAVSAILLLFNIAEIIILMVVYSSLDVECPEYDLRGSKRKKNKIE